MCGPAALANSPTSGLRENRKLAMAYTFPLGPYHPALEEPFKVNVQCKGEIIESATIEVGFSYRGIELLAQQRNWIEVVTLIERVCGICSNTHASTFCMAAESIAGIEIPRSAPPISARSSPSWSACTRTFCGPASAPRTSASIPCSWRCSTCANG